MDDPTSRPALYIPALGGLYRSFEGWSYALVRFCAGLWLIPHGAQKLFGMFGGHGIAGTAAFFAKIGLAPPVPLAYLVGCTEFFGGLLIAIGFLTRPAAVAASILLAVIVFYVRLSHGFFGVGYELLWLVVMLLILMRGGGPVSVDSAIGKEF